LVVATDEEDNRRIPEDLSSSRYGVFIIPMPVSAILTAALAYWLLGVIWYSWLFGRIWRAGLESRGLRIDPPTRPRLVTQLILTFLATCLVATAVAWVLQCFSVTGAGVASRLAMVLGVGIATATLAIGSAWESKSLKMFLLDAGYHILGVWLCAMVLLQWRR